MTIGALGAEISQHIKFLQELINCDVLAYEDSEEERLKSLHKKKVSIEIILLIKL